GNVCSGFDNALQCDARQKFIEPLMRRSAGSSPLAVFTYMTGPQAEDQLPLPPEPCRYCYKMLGV
ncbi:MAG: hypothetical protein AB1649_27165, partial [Chloroflexota bacterium]